MNPKLASLLLLSALGACDRERSAAASDSEKVRVSPTHADVSAWTVRPDAYGPLPLGVEIARAIALLGKSFVVDTSRLDVCQMVRSAEMPPTVRFLVERDSAGARLERIDVADSSVHTDEGARVGDSESRIRQLYGTRVQVQPHKYTAGGHYLIVGSTSDTLHRFVFETDGQRVTRFRAGRRPAVDYVEACG